MAVKDCLQHLSGAIKNLKNSNYLDSASSTAAIAQGLYKASTQPGFMKKLDAYVRNMYLSGLGSHIQNTVSNIMNIALNPIITLAASPFSKHYQAADVARQLTGIGKGFMLAGPRFWDNLSQTLKQGGIGNVPDAAAELAYQAGGKVSDIQWMNRIATFPIALTKALDDGSRAVLESMGSEVTKAKLLADPRLEAFAKKQKMSKEELSKELGNLLMGNPSKLDILQNTIEFGKYRKEIEMWADFNLYNQPLGKSPIDQLAKKVEGVREALPGIGSFILPYIKIPVNVAKEGATFIPALGELRTWYVKKDIARNAEVLSSTREKFNAAKDLLSQQRKTNADPMLIGQTKSRLEKLNQDLIKLEGAKDYLEKLPARFRAQQMIGLGVGVATYSLAQSGLVTGHFNDPSLRAKMKAAGIPEMSVKVGDRWVNYGRLEPFATIMGIAADWVQHEKSMATEGKALLGPELVEAVPKILAQNFLDKTFTQTLGQMLAAVQDPGRHGTWFANLAGGIVPAGVTQAAKLQEPTERETKEGLASVKNVIQSRIPHSFVTDALGIPTRKDLAPKIDILGQPVQAHGSVVEGLLGKTPLTPAIEAAIGIPQAKQNVVQAALMNPYVKVGDMSRKALGIELTPKQIASLRTDTGQEITSQLYDLVTSQDFKQSTRPEQAAEINRYFERIRQIKSKELAGDLIDIQPDAEAQYEKPRKVRKGDIPDTAPRR